MKKFLWNFISVLILFLSTSAWPATWPARQAPDWDLGLQTWLYVGHNSDGTLKGSVSQGEWDQNGATGTYVDPYIDRFTVPGDMTAEFQAGRAVWALLTGTDCYSTVASATYTTLTTVILNDSCIDNTVSHVTWGIISAGTITSLPILPLDIIPATLTGKNADMVDGYDAGNAAGNVPVSNGVLNTNLNADKVDGYHASEGAEVVAYPTTDQVIESGSTGEMVVWTEQKDTGGNFASDFFTAPTNGFYVVNVNIRWMGGGSASGTREIKLRGGESPNWYVVYYADTKTAVNTDPFCQSLNIMVYLDAGSKLCVFLSQTSGGDESIRGTSSSYSNLSIFRVSR